MTPLLARFSAAMLLAAAWLLVGCASTSNGPTTLGVIQVNVDWKWTAYQQAGATGGFTLAQQQQVEAAKRNFDQAFAAALAQAGNNLGTPAPPAVVNAANEFFSVVGSALDTL
jgi:hypothetical protein